MKLVRAEYIPPERLARVQERVHQHVVTVRFEEPRARSGGPGVAFWAGLLFGSALLLTLVLAS